MNKHLIRIIVGGIFLLVITYIAVFIYDNSLHKQEDSKRPNNFSSYWDKGYLIFDPRTILTSRDIENKNIFTPLIGDPNNIKETNNINIRWTQADFLKIASTLGKFMWSDSMDLNNWKVYYIGFGGKCDNPLGYDSATITYFQLGGKRYVTRLIEIEPYLSWARWGNGETYPIPILQKWVNVDLPGSRISADDALRIASEDARERFQFKNDTCSVLIGSPQANDPNNWYLDIFYGSIDSFLYVVNINSGESKIQK
jgi:hypothetical protein